MKNFKTIAEVCEELKITRQTVYRWKNKGLINIIKSQTGSVFVEVASYENIKKFTEDYEEIK